MKVTPKPTLLEAYRYAPLGWTRALAEFIDNALDASATHVTIIADGRRLNITDNGVGVSDMEALFTLGEHRPHPGGRGLGRFGIGFKEAALWLWGAVHVRSIRGTKRYETSLAWSTLARSAEWEVEDPTVESAAASDLPGTALTMSSTDRRFPGGKDLDAVISELGFIFSPALKRGATIVLRRDRAAPVQLSRVEAPPMHHVTMGMVTVADREVHVSVGVVEEGIPNPHAGISYVHRHRVIILGSALGCGPTSTARIFGWVILGDQWELTKNKDEISAHREALGDAVQRFIQPTLDVAGQQAEILEVTGLESDLTNMLREALGGKPLPKTEKERRDPGDEEGTVEPVGTGRKRGAVKRQPGNRLPGRIDAGRLRLEFRILDDREGIGLFDVHGNRVTLALNHPYVAQLRANGRAGRTALFQLALSLVVHHCVIEPESAQQVIPAILALDQAKQFRVMLGQFMASVIA